MTSREIAFNVLKQWRPRAAHATRVLEDTLSHESPAPVERALAMELVYGVIRRRETLSALLRAHVNRPLSQVEPEALIVLWLGAYQLAMLSNIPAYAVVNEMAALTKRLAQPRWTGFVNGVLRSLSRSVTGEIVSVPAANAVPLSEGRYRVLKDDVFPDPSQDWPGYFLAAFSYPKWLAERWQKRFDREELTRLAFWFNAPARLCLRVNTLRTTRENLLDALHRANIAARAGEHPEAVWLEQSSSVQRLPGFEEGWFSVQDETAMAAATLLGPEPGQRVLDFCAAPGGKTTHIAGLMRNTGRILATDVDAGRLARVGESCRVLGADIVETRHISRDRNSQAGEVPAADGLAGDSFSSEKFDRIMLDVPCSNTGVLGKRPEVRWRLKPRDITELAAIQKRLLSAACGWLAPGGRIVYSTCSIEPEENQGVVGAALHDRPEMKLVQEISHIPGRPADGGYLALLRVAL